jgi:diguanylate cyclase (GGDEF)-like protein
MTHEAAAGQTFRRSAEVVLDYLRKEVPMGVWSITRIENDQQTHLVLDDNSYGLVPGDATAWSDTYCVHMVAGDTPQVTGQAHEISEYAQAKVNDTLDIAAYAGAPIRESDGTLFGVICGLDPEEQADLPRVGPTLNALSGMLEVALSADREQRHLAAALEGAQQESTTDALTGVGNRRAWQQWLARLENDYGELADPTVVAVVDLDNFKAFNDGPGGHAAGDEALKAVAAAIAQRMRDGDHVARIGGDEFGVILRDCSTAKAPEVIERIREAIAATGVEASIGWESLRVGTSVDECVRCADEAMFARKGRGRQHDPASSA